jgi:AraC family transcriptional regulator of arabinose operon
MIDRANGIVDFLFLFVKTPAAFIVDKRIFTIDHPSVILMDSYVPHKYFPTGQTYIDDYLHFDSQERDKFISELTFPMNIPIQITDSKQIDTILSDIMKENYPANKYWNKIMDLLISLLMIKVSEQYDILNRERMSVPHFDKLAELRNQILASPEKKWSVENLSCQMCLSPAYFQTVYKKAFGVTCITDVINSRISQAKILLTTTDMPVNQVSNELGYDEVYHFIRQFKKNIGLTPGLFRKKLKV